jgi:tetratricopeptide (TPR) repeat protein
MAAALRVVASESSAPLPIASAGDDPAGVLNFLEERVRKDPDDIVAQNRLADVYLHRLRETGGYQWLQRARAAAQRSLAAVPAEQNAEGLVGMIRVEHESHHFVTARDLACELTKIEPNKHRSFALLGDALLEAGDLEKAGEAYAQMQRRGGTPVETETRLARLDLARGALDSARVRFGKALDSAREAAPPQPQMVAWCLLQLGQLGFRTGDWARAEKHYQSVLALLPDDARTLEHLAELRAAEEKYEEAISLYGKVIARVPRPEYWHALGDVYVAMGKPAEAAPWHERAREAYLKNASEGNDHYFHHLAGYYSDAEENPTEAVKWARKDMTLRQSAGAHDALAWALYRAGEYAAAAEAATAALSSGTKDAHILFHAGMIFLAAGDIGRGKEMLAEAARVNPRHQSFHAHR